MYCQKRFLIIYNYPVIFSNFLSTFNIFKHKNMVGHWWTSLAALLSGISSFQGETLLSPSQSSRTVQWKKPSTCYTPTCGTVSAGTETPPLCGPEFLDRLVSVTGESLRPLLPPPLLPPPLRLKTPGVAEEAPERAKEKKKEIKFIVTNENTVCIYKCRIIAKRESLLASELQILSTTLW